MDNKHTKPNEPIMADELSVSLHEGIVDFDKLHESKTSNITSASAKNINLLYYDEGAAESLPAQPSCSTTTVDTDSSSMHMFTDVVGKCPECASNIQPNVDFSRKKERVNKVLINCPYVTAATIHIYLQKGF